MKININRKRDKNGEELYPEEMTIDESDRLFENFESFDDETKAAKFANKTNGQLYTQVDGDKDRVYLRGHHFVNRTGWWIVVKR